MTNQINSSIALVAEIWGLGVWKPENPGTCPTCPAKATRFSKAYFAFWLTVLCP